MSFTDAGRGAEYFDVGAGTRVRPKLLVVKAYWGIGVEVTKFGGVKPLDSLSYKGSACFKIAADRCASTTGGCLISGKRLKPFRIDGRVEYIRVRVAHAPLYWRLGCFSALWEEYLERNARYLGELVDLHVLCELPVLVYIIQGYCSAGE